MLFQGVDSPADALHKTRLLNVEEKPFKRITKRLLNDQSWINKPYANTTPSAEDANGDTAVRKTEQAEILRKEREAFRDDVILDFAAFESSIARIQFLRTSNEKERERYAAEKLRIQTTAQDVRENTASLRIQLEEAQKTLAVRKTYDELAEKITSNPALKPRDEQQVNLEKLRAEIQDLEQESQDYAQTWSERKAQFARIMEEGLQLRRLIRDEKEEAERREGMEDGEDIEEARGRASNTPAPREDNGGLTPMHSSQQGSGALSPGTQKVASTRGVSPLRQEATPAAETKTVQEVEDTDMADEGEVEELATSLPTETKPQTGEMRDTLEKSVANGDEPLDKPDDAMDVT